MPVGLEQLDEAAIGDLPDRPRRLRHLRRLFLPGLDELAISNLSYRTRRLRTLRTYLHPRLGGRQQPTAGLALPGPGLCENKAGLFLQHRKISLRGFKFV